MSPYPRASEPDESSDTLELSAIQADDALLDALGGSDPQVADGLGDQELNALLLAWRRDIDSEPIADLVDTATAVTTIKAASIAKRHAGRGRRRRMLVPVAAAAAVLAIGFTGTALAARDAQPGDTLWGLSKVLYADHARSVEAAASVRTDLEAAYLAIAQERYEDARRALQAAEASLGQVTAEDELAQLKARHTELMAQLNKPPTNPGNNNNQPPPLPGPPDSSSSTATDTKPTEEPHLPLPTEPGPTELPDTSTSPTTDPSTSSSEPPPPSTSTSGDTTSGESGSSGQPFGKQPNAISGGSVESSN
nr:anti-sigma-D factor RsdA [Prauserella cavernicola]